jgi:hypothetical protein
MNSSPLRFAFALMSGLCVAVSATAQTPAGPPDGLTAFVYPQAAPAQKLPESEPWSEVSTRDIVYVGYLEHCRDSPILLRDPPPRVQREGQRLVIELEVSDEPPICFAAPPPFPTPVLFPLGVLEAGTYEVERRVMLRTGPNTAPTLLHSAINRVRVGATPHAAVSGAWYEPSNPGTGLILNLLPNAPGEAEPQVMVFYAVLDTNDQPDWYSGIGRFNNGILQIDLQRGGSSGQTRLLQFSYLGCARAQLQDAQRPTFAPIELRQLTGVKAVQSCAPEPTTVAR